MAIPSNETKFSGEIRVASRIIDYLSSGLYKSPAACLKELVNNSFDADAGRVDIFVKPDANRIIIADDGKGMTRDEFENHFKHVSESHKRDSGETTGSGRPKIGKIGIGFIAANELCEIMEVYSTKRGSSELLHVYINFNEMKKTPEERRRENREFVKADYEGEILPAEKSQNYTQIFLQDIRGEAREILAGALPAQSNPNVSSLYGLSAASINRLLTDERLATWDTFDTYSKTMLKVALNVPVVYQDHWISQRLKVRVREYEEEVSRLNFQVYYDGTELKKPIAFPKSERAFVSQFSFRGKHVGARGYFYAQHGSIKPKELHGLLVRIRNAAVGEYDSSFWQFSKTESPLIQGWISAEIWADDGLEAAMNIDRSTLRESHPAYVELQRAIHSHLRRVLTKARKEIYGAASAVRKTERASQEAVAIKRSLRSALSQSAPATTANLVKSWVDDKTNPESQHALLRKYSVSELYTLVIEVASKILTPKQMKEFLERLTERLRS